MVSHVNLYLYHVFQKGALCFYGTTFPVTLCQCVSNFNKTTIQINRNLAVNRYDYGQWNVIQWRREHTCMLMMTHSITHDRWVRIEYYDKKCSVLMKPSSYIVR